jgi:F-type H+-transporting ATPase subunit delta
MKIKPRQFALSLYEALDGKPSGEVKAIIGRFVELLAEKKQLSRAEKIIAEFIKIYNLKHGIIEAHLISGSELNSEAIKALNDYIKKLSGAKEIVVSQTVDKNILGGVIIKYGDKVFDASLKTVLSDLKEKMIKF